MGRRRLKLDPIAAARAKRAARCPDCNSDVAIDRTTHELWISHDHGCPALASLQRQGRTTQLAIVKTAGQTAEEFDDSAARMTRAIADRYEQIWPGATGLRVSLGDGYTDLYPGGAQ